MRVQAALAESAWCFELSDAGAEGGNIRHGRQRREYSPEPIGGGRGPITYKEKTVLTSIRTDGYGGADTEMTLQVTRSMTLSLFFNDTEREDT